MRRRDALAVRVFMFLSVASVVCWRCRVHRNCAFANRRCSAPRRPRCKQEGCSFEPNSCSLPLFLQLCRFRQFVCSMGVLINLTRCSNTRSTPDDSRLGLSHVRAPHDTGQHNEPSLLLLRTGSERSTTALRRFRAQNPRSEPKALHQDRRL